MIGTINIGSRSRKSVITNTNKRYYYVSRADTTLDCLGRQPCLHVLKLSCSVDKTVEKRSYANIYKIHVPPVFGFVQRELFRLYTCNKTHTMRCQVLIHSSINIFTLDVFVLFSGYQIKFACVLN